MISIFQPGHQVVRVPLEADGDVFHPNSEFGFIMRIIGDNAFVRYWSKANPTELRTKGGSELTPLRFLWDFQSHPQKDIEHQMALILQQMMEDV